MSGERSKHTPGPWRTGSLVSWDARTGEPLAFVYRRPRNDPRETADNRICIRGGDDVDADARLIAAAPELYESLKLLLEEARGKVYIPNEGKLLGWEKKVVAAIRKAEGGEP